MSSLFHIFKLGFPIGLTELATVGFFASSTFLVGMLGVDLLAAHAIAFHVTELAIVFFFGFEEVATIKVGLVLGKKQGLGKINALLRNLLIATAAISAVIVIVLFAFSGKIPNIFLSVSEKHQPIMSLATILILIGATVTVFEAFQIVLLGALRGMKDTAAPMVNVVVGYWLVGVPLSYYFSQVLDYSAPGVWYGLGCGLVLVCALLSFRLNRMRVRITSKNN
jgi:MATE family multidrug resistance protein